MESWRSANPDALSRAKQDQISVDEATMLVNVLAELTMVESRISQCISRQQVVEESVELEKRDESAQGR